MCAQTNLCIDPLFHATGAGHGIEWEPLRADSEPGGQRSGRCGSPGTESHDDAVTKGAKVKEEMVFR